MNKLTKLTASVLALVSASATAEVTGEFSTGYSSEYFFRGMDRSAGLEALDFGLDFKGDCDCGLTWNAGVWYISTDSQASPDELDFYGSLGKDVSFGALSANASVGYIRYTYPQNGQIAGASTSGKRSHDGEIFLSLATEAYGLSLGATAYFGEEGRWDNGTWLDLNASYTQEIANGLSATAKVGFGYSFGNYSTGGVQQPYGDMGGLALITSSLGLQQIVSDSITVSAHVTNIQSTEDYGKAGGQDHTFYGLGATYTF